MNKHRGERQIRLKCKFKSKIKINTIKKSRCVYAIHNFFVDFIHNCKKLQHFCIRSTKMYVIRKIFLY